jgi:phosphoribosylaminoimidazole-succinocarboxamide synthase
MPIKDSALGNLIAEGKTKRIYAHSSNNELVYMVSKDCITAGDGARRNSFAGKAHWSTTIAANIFTLLNEAKIATHFVKQVDDNTLLVSYCKMLPIEQVQRRFATGSYLKNHPETAEGTRFESVLVETFLKDDARHDPQIWQDGIVKMDLATVKEIDWMV